MKKILIPDKKGYNGITANIRAYYREEFDESKPIASSIVRKI